MRLVFAVACSVAGISNLAVHRLTAHKALRAMLLQRHLKLFQQSLLMDQIGTFNAVIILLALISGSSILTLTPGPSREFCLDRKPR